MTWKVWKRTAGFGVPAHDHDHADRRQNQVGGEEFPDAVYRCWRDGDRDLLANCRRLQEDHRGENGCECIQRELDRDQWTCGPDAGQKGEDSEVAAAVEGLGDVDREAEWGGLGLHDVPRRRWVVRHINVRRGCC